MRGADDEDFDGPFGLKDISWDNNHDFDKNEAPQRPFTAGVFEWLPGMHRGRYDILEVRDAKRRVVVNAWITEPKQLKKAQQFLLDLCNVKFTGE